MRIKDFFTAVAAFAVIAGLALAQAAQPVTGAAAPLDNASSIGGGSSLLIIALVVALGIGVYFITKSHNGPDSPSGLTA